MNGTGEKFVLDLVTVAFNVLWESRTTSADDVRKWLDEVQTVFVEENTHYRLDNAGGVHFHFDESFSAVARRRSLRFMQHDIGTSWTPSMAR